MNKECLVLSLEGSDDYFFAQLQIVGGEFNRHHFYAFNRRSKPVMLPGMRLNIDFGNLDFFHTNNGVKVFYNKYNFSTHEVMDLKTYNFHIEEEGF